MPAWSSSLTIMILLKKLKPPKKGDIYSVPESMQFIEGDFVIENDHFIFTPSKLNKFEKRNFKLIYKTKKNRSCGRRKQVFLQSWRLSATGCYDGLLNIEKEYLCFYQFIIC